MEASTWTDADHSLETDDPWHEHTGEEPPQESHGTTSPGVIALVGVVSFVILGVTVWVLVVLFNGYLSTEEYRKQDLADLGRDVAATKAEEYSLLRTTEWTDPRNDKVRIPIEQAMDIVVQEYQQAR